MSRFLNVTKSIRRGFVKFIKTVGRVLMWVLATLSEASRLWRIFAD